MAKFHENKAKLNNLFFNFDLKCENCGMKFSDFDHMGLVGCERCYESFKENLEPILERIHGSAKHIGSRPTNRRSKASVQQLTHYRQLLSQAINSQNFEEAAQLRDIIKDIERQLH